MKEQKASSEEEIKNLKAMTDKMKKKIDYCKEQMEKGNEHIQTLEEKKSTYKKQIIALKQHNNQNNSNKDTIVQKQEQQLQAKIAELTDKNSQIRELNIDKQKIQNELDEAQNMNKSLSQKLDESIKSLESNAQLIQWFNKQLNQKQSSVSNNLFTGAAGSSTITAPISKPPMSSMAGSTFKPSISSIDQMGAGSSTMSGLGARSGSKGNLLDTSKDL